MTRALLVDDHPLFVVGLSALVRRTLGAEIVGTASSAGQAGSLAASASPSLAVVGLGAGDRLGLIRDLAHGDPALRIVALTEHGVPDAERDCRAGAHGSASRRAPSGSIEAVLRDVVQGRRGEPGHARRGRAHATGHPDGAPPAPVGLLTGRERDAFRLFGRGLPTTEVARAMGVSVKTIETYRLSIKGKLGVASNNAFIHTAVLWSLGHEAAHTPA